MRWLQPDTIIPQPNNPQSWNRYSYVQDNPIRYNDPSGHKEQCEGQECDRPTLEEQLASLKKTIKDKYKWNVMGNDWSLGELRTIYQTGRGIENYVNNLTGGKGQAWMNAYLGGTDIMRSPWYAPQNQNTTFPGWLSHTGANTVNLFPGWEKQDGGLRWLTHEMGHVWDMNTGYTTPRGAMGGVGDSLNTYIGGSIASTWDSRFSNDSGSTADPNIPSKMVLGMELVRFNPSVSNGYGNGSTADYLAESFAWNPIDHQTAPAAASAWVDQAIIAQAASLP